MQELYGDFQAIDSGLFLAPLERNAACLVPPAWQPGQAQALEDRSISALAAVVLSMKRKPLIRYQANSGEEALWQARVLRTLITAMGHMSVALLSGRPCYCKVPFEQDPHVLASRFTAELQGTV